MNPFDPANVVNLSGTCTMRGVTLALPTDTVRDLLPHGLELGSQSLTEAGTHPVMLGFHDMYRLHLSIPNLLPNMAYREHVVGIPCCYAVNSPFFGGSAGPYFFMPTLRLDNALAAFGGVTLWGLAKQLARFDARAGHYRVLGEDGRPLVTASWEDVGEFKHISEFPHFDPVKEILAQPLIGMMPFAVGPWFIVADFPKRWEITTMRPLRTVTDVHTDYVTGFSSGRYPEKGESPGIDECPLGSFEMRTEWLMSAPYFPYPH